MSGREDLDAVRAGKNTAVHAEPTNARDYGGETRAHAQK